MSVPAFTQHALERIAERFADIDIENAYANSGRVGRKTRQKIKASCPVSARKWMSGGFKGRYYRITKDKIVFVVQPPETVVTVFRLDMEQATHTRCGTGNGSDLTHESGDKDARSRPVNIRQDEPALLLPEASNAF